MRGSEDPRAGVDIVPNGKISVFVGNRKMTFSSRSVTLLTELSPLRKIFRSKTKAMSEQLKKIA
jgi:hypothetical protein